VNSSVSPGRKNPMSNPVSAKMMARIPSTPNVVINDWGSRKFTASSTGRAYLAGVRVSAVRRASGYLQKGHAARFAGLEPQIPGS
jgi:hypothetical protein